MVRTGECWIILEAWKTTSERKEALSRQVPAITTIYAMRTVVYYTTNDTVQSGEKILRRLAESKACRFSIENTTEVAKT